MAKPLCKWLKKRSVKHNLDRYLEKISHPTAVCLKCGRVANSDKRLCAPRRLEST